MPVAVLLLPTVLDLSDAYPMAVLLSPVLSFINANDPMAIFLEPGALMPSA